MQKVKYLILGAGPCGLGAAWRLQELNETDFLVLDAESRAGGLARSFVDEKGFTWDIGGHVQFSHYQDFDRVMGEVLPNEWYEHQRESWVWIEDRFVPYPFQNNIHRLTPESRDKCLQGLESLNHRSMAAPKNFNDWIVASFGPEIAEVFMTPYNKKVWAFDPEKMNFKWIGERVAQVDVSRIKENIELNRDDLSWGPNATFRFPKSGGTGRIWKEVAARISSEKIQLDSEVISIDTQNKLVKTKTETISYEFLLSTIPLNRLFSLADLKLPQPPDHQPILSSNSHIVGIGLKGQTPPALKTKCWIYFPENNCPFYRATVFSNYSPAHTPDSQKYWSLMCETSESVDKTLNENSIVEETIQGLINTSMIQSKEEVVSQWHFAAKPGYPTPFLGRDEWVREAQSILEPLDIASRGRFGNWLYEVSNQDHSFMQGFEWANAKLHSTKEVTAFSPSTVNAPGKREKIPSSWCL